MNSVSIRTKEMRFPVCKSLYGLFFEDINRSGDGGLYPEMIRNRSFDDSLYPEDLTACGDDVVNANGWKLEYQKGEGQKRWKAVLPPTEIPAWYSDGAPMRLERTDTLNANRQAALKVRFRKGDSIWNIGFGSVAVREGCEYRLYLYAKADRDLPLEFLIEDGEKACCRETVTVREGGYTRYDLILNAGATSRSARFRIMSREEGCLRIGFISLMPADTYMGHGLRKDLCEKLKALHPAFLRFPGGCIVEGFSRSTVQRFERMVGPVWERPGVLNLWGYRSTEGLGFHEYLQLCEDLGADALYVCNCGMTCQVRGPILMDREEIDGLLADVMNALEYALGDKETKWGALRARMGHEAPFALRYLEIGNENNGPDYLKRYEYFRKSISEKYPELTIVANTHVEEDGLDLDIADEHFYDKAEWFASNSHHYDGYDRNGPGIFVGEYAVVAGDIRTLYTAVGEAMFLIGLERNQDIIRLASYAPLFENVRYAAWEPNLIAFDGLDSYAIPSYYVQRLFAENRGSRVVESTQESSAIYAPYLKGGPCLAGSEGVRFRNPVWKGQPVKAGREIFGNVRKLDGNEYTTRILPDSGQAENAERFGMADKVLIVFGDDLESREGRFEIELMAEEGKELGIGMFSTPYGKARNSEDSPWNLFSVQPVRWTIKDGRSRLISGVGFRQEEMTEAVSVELVPGRYYSLAMETDGRKLTCTLNGEKLMETELPHYDSIQTVAAEDEEYVYLKLANISAEAADVEISLDCDIQADYEVQMIAGNPKDKNTLDAPDTVGIQKHLMTGAGKRFAFMAPGTSVSVLKLKKGEREER